MQMVPWLPAPHVRKRLVIGPREQPGRIRPIRPEARARLLEAVAKARMWVDEIASGQALGTDVIARRERCSERSVRMTLSLAFLSPELICAAVDGTLPHGLGLSRLTDLPLSWNKQHATILGSHSRFRLP